MDAQVYDLPRALKAFGSEQIIREMLRTYLEQIGGMLGKLRRAIEEKNIQEVRSGVHWMRGGLSYVHAARVRKACLELDATIHEEPMPEPTPAFQNLEAEVKILECHLREHLHL